MSRRSVPLGAGSAVGFIGAGRFGTSLAVALQRSEYRVTAVASRTRESAREFCSRVDGCVSLDSPQAVADVADIVFVATSDAAVPEVAGSVDWRPGQSVVHPSGVLPVASLERALLAGAATGGFHILQTFPSRDSAALIGGSACAIDASDQGLLEWLWQAARAIGAIPFRMSDEHRSAYHASAIMSCGLVAAMLGIAAEMWRPMGVSRDRALAALQPLAAATVREIGLNGLPDAFTGPFVRGDVDTIARHLIALGAQDSGTARAYAAVGAAGLPLFAEHPGLSREAAGRIAALLAGQLAAAGSAVGADGSPVDPVADRPRRDAPEGEQP